MRYLVIITLLLLGCKSRQPAVIDIFIPDHTTGPPTMVYKTRADYRNLVPVMLSADKTRIIGYPGPNDLADAVEFPIPTKLRGGYWLDNRGISKDVAFLNMTYEAYSKLESLPSVDEMYAWIIDKDPLTALCNCGSRNAFTDIDRQLNALIKSGKLNSVCRVIK
jgi:hypothetical protein